MGPETPYIGKLEIATHLQIDTSKRVLPTDALKITYASFNISHIRIYSKRLEGGKNIEMNCTEKNSYSKAINKTIRQLEANSFTRGVPLLI